MTEKIIHPRKDLKDISFLHIYGQKQWHMNVSIVGNRKALETLKNTIEKCLSDEQDRAKFTAFVTDGEGYDVCIVRRDEHWRSRDDKNEMKHPYTDEVAIDRSGAIDPEELFYKRKKHIIILTKG